MGLFATLFDDQVFHYPVFTNHRFVGLPVVSLSIALARRSFWSAGSYCVKKWHNF